MKRKLTILLAIGMLALSCIVITTTTSGCATQSAGTWQTDIATTANLAAYVGASVDLKDNPDRRPLWVASMEALNTIIRDADYNPSKFLAALESLPVKELRSGKGTLIVGAAVILWNRAASRIDINQVELVKLVAPAVRDGIKQALASN